MDCSEDLDLETLLELLDGDETNANSDCVPDEICSINDPGNSTSQQKQENCDKPKKQDPKGILEDIPFEDCIKDKDINNKVNSTKGPKETKTPYKNKLYSEIDSPRNVEESIRIGLGKYSDDEDEPGLSEYGQSIMRNLTETKSYDKQKRRSTSWSVPNKPGAAVESIMSEKFSGIRIINSLVSNSVLQQRMEGRRMVKMSLIKNYLVNGGVEGDWVTMGVLVSKVPPKTTKTGKPFSIWKMSDLLDPEKIISVFLFGEAHTEHWKIAVGTVVGILNPSILPDADKFGAMQLSVDMAGKLLLMGTSKDLGFCKFQKADGRACGNVVNMNQCEFCIFHVKKAYKKFSAKRSELQASFNGRDAGRFSGSDSSFKNKLLKGQNFFYAGHTFGMEKGQKKPIPAKDKLTLSNLGLKRKAEKIETEEKAKGIKTLTEMYGPAIKKAAQGNSEFINSQLIIPNAGSRNLLQHLMKNKPQEESSPAQVISPKEFLKMREQQLYGNKISLKEKDNATLGILTPKLGKGLKPGQNITFDFARAKTIHNKQELAKIRAIKIIKEKGPLQPKDPNCTKTSPKSITKPTVENKSVDTENAPIKEKSSQFQSKLGNIDLNSEKIKQILKRKSSHAHEVQMYEQDKEEFYFNNMEKKEQMESKLVATKEIVCSVVSCLQCKYTAHTASDRCKNENHSIKCHKAIKRFFACTDCKTRTCSFTRYPKKACKNCGGSNFEHTGMMKEKKGPILDSEKLNIRGDEVKYLQSLKYNLASNL